jgi:hypothetical protein
VSYLGYLLPPVPAGKQTLHSLTLTNSMKKNYFLAAITLAIVFAACSSSKKPTGVWVNKDKIAGKSYSSIFIIAMTADIPARVRLEGDIANAAASRGLKTVKSIDVMPVDLQDPKMPTKEEAIAKIKASGCDAAFVTLVLKKEESVKYTPGTTAYSQLPYYTLSGYYSNWYPTVSTPDYYEHDKEYFMQSNLYDVASEEKIWSVDSQVFNPTSIESFSKSYTQNLISQLHKANLIRK